MKVTAFVFHPNIEKSRVNKRLIEEINEEVETRLLYEIYPDGVIDVTKEQNILEQTDRIIIQFPMYWYSSPALLKEWQDKVLTYGWAYGNNGNSLRNKELVLAVTPGASISQYSHEGSFKYKVTELLRPFQATSNLIGTRFIKPFIADGMQQSDNELSLTAQQYKDYIMSSDLDELEAYE
ncbi:NAD(P)H-dependent oxidoreductase [Lactococcus lactis]|uniref:NAD(P)H-dependent oxidoreductase n=1 Tax=Lactococcus lactis TaxID=1358 RepID=UPI00111E9F12|nr:NAD(P)H-dependent oxidoreductase [Lactococcus lactis]MCC4119255.1 NAD(P)H-dependent oxidoreductase [Lactococcus lactis]TNU81212.1 flavodoxin family protein [Lactococcus lactis subsp. lactis]